MKYKFKVEDKVRIVRNTGNMVAKNKYIGQVHTILNINPNREFGYYLENCNGWLWKEDDLELAVCQDKIVITNDGKTTKATLYHGDTKTVATAKCSPEDTFDFNVGAKMAMERLMEAVEPPKYYNGKIVCIDNCGNLNKYTVGKIYTIEDGVIIDSNDGVKCPTYSPCKTFKDWEDFSSSKWLEIKE